jgi:hypothetical protein
LPCHGLAENGEQGKGKLTPFSSIPLYGKIGFAGLVASSKLCNGVGSFEGILKEIAPLTSIKK